MPTRRNLPFAACIRYTASTNRRAADRERGRGFPSRRHDIRTKESPMILRRRIRPLAGLALALGVSLAALSGAAAQPAGRTITIVVPYMPGSGPDILGRTIGEELQNRWNQPFVVDNKPGASGNIGAQ